MRADAIDKTQHGSKCCGPYWRVLVIPRAPAAHLLMQIRHILVVPEKPFFRRGCCVLKTAHHFEGSEKHRVFRMKRGRIGSALAGLAVCALACALLWPRARDAGAILAAQDDPAALADVQLNAAVRNNQAVIAQNIEAALAAGDADLANSFVDLAREKNIPVNDEFSRRVGAAITEENLSSPFSKRFSTRLLTG